MYLQSANHIYFYIYFISKTSLKNIEPAIFQNFPLFFSSYEPNKNFPKFSTLFSRYYAIQPCHHHPHSARISRFSPGNTPLFAEAQSE